MEVLETLLVGDYKIYQDDTLYRFTSDSVILSRFAQAKNGDYVLDLCSGCGIVGINHYLLTKLAKKVELVEIQKPLCDLAQKTIDLNELNGVFTVINKPIQELSSENNLKYSLVLCNPPYKKKDTGEKSLELNIAICKHEIMVTQEEIVKVASKKLKHGGRFCICQRVERFTDLIVDLKNNHLEPTKIQFVKNKENVEPYLVLIEATKNTKPKLKILDTIVNGGY